MPSKPRVVIPGVACHVTQRGNYRQPVFFTDNDRLLYLDLIAKAAVEYWLQLLGWCLMPNHVHWLVIPLQANAMALTFRRGNSRYSSYVNGRQGRSAGHLWQNRFYSCPLTENHLWRALRYIELNPLRGHLAENPAEYRWSSAAFHVGLLPPPAWMDLTLWATRFDTNSWAEVLKNEEQDWDELRRATRRGSIWPDDKATVQSSAMFGFLA